MTESYIHEGDYTQSVNFTLNKRRQKLPFNAVYCGEFHVGDKYFTKRDGWDNYLLIVTTGGCGIMSQNGQSCLLTPGSAVIINCNALHEYRTAKDQNWNFYFLHFDAMTMNGYNNVLLKKLTPVMLRLPDKVYGKMAELCRISEDYQPNEQFIISNTISDILTEMICSVSENEENIAHHERDDINKLREYIDNNFTEELDIDGFMSRTNLSRYYLIHLFKKQTGTSPCRYMHMCRISYSQKLLSSSTLPVSEIAEKAGYNSTAVFIRHFKSFNKITPGKYRCEFYDYNKSEDS